MAGNSCFSTLAVIFLLLSTTTTTTATSTSTADRHHARKLIKPNPNEVSPFCKTATTKPDDKSICTGLVKGAKTWPEAMTNAITSVIGIANAAKPMVYGVGKKLPAGLLPITVESIAKGCKDTFDTYVFNLEQCVGFVKHDPTSALEVYLSGSTFRDCKNGLDEFQVTNPQVDKFYDTTIKYADILLSVYQTKPQK